MAPAPNPVQAQDPAGLMINTTAAATQAVSLTLDRLLNVATSPTTGIGDIDSALDQIRKDLDSLTTTQSSEEEDIKKLLEEALNNEVLEHLSTQIEEQINKCIDKNVKALVEEELDKYVPRDVRAKVDEQKTELLSLQIQIHNSEARRLNSFIKTQKHFGENLQPLVDDGGHRTPLFPKTVNELLEFDDAKVFQLVQFFGMENPSPDSRILNLNWFLRRIGVTYQYVYRGPFRPFPP